MAKKILCLIPNPNDALSFYRAMGPIRRMYQDGVDLHFEYATDFNWSKISQYDALFAQRPYRGSHLQVLKIATDWGIPVVMDYDDWLFDLKTDNPGWRLYSRNQEVTQAVSEAWKYATVLMVATEKLAELYRAKGAKDVRVVPNAYDRKLFSYIQPTERRKIVLWRGSDTHVHDCITVLKGYEELVKKHKDWTFVFMHQYPWFFSRQYDNMVYLDGLETIEYFRKIYELAPAVMCHPLSDCDFNRAKSMACYLEATHAGAAFVGPAFEEFNRPGCTQYAPEDPNDFFTKIDSIITQPDRIKPLHSAAWKYATGDGELGNVNRKRIEIFKSL